MRKTKSRRVTDESVCGIIDGDKHSGGQQAWEGDPCAVWGSTVMERGGEDRSCLQVAFACVSEGRESNRVSIIQHRENPKYQGCDRPVSGRRRRSP